MTASAQRADARQRPRGDRRDGRRSGLDGRAAHASSVAPVVHVVDQRHRPRQLFQRGDVDPARRPAGLPARACRSPAWSRQERRCAAARRRMARLAATAAAGSKRGAAAALLRRHGVTTTPPRSSSASPQPAAITPVAGSAARNFSLDERAPDLRRPSAPTNARTRATGRAAAAPVPRQAAARAAPPAQPRERAQAGSAQQLVRRAQRLPAGDARRRRDDREQLGARAASRYATSARADDAGRHDARPPHGTRPRRAGRRTRLFRLSWTWRHRGTDGVADQHGIVTIPCLAARLPWTAHRSSSRSRA